MSSHKKALLVVNLGTPDKPEVVSVYRYLTEFLNDKRVIDLPYILRKFLVNVIIIPFRVINSTKLYQQLWTDKGSPLLTYLEDLQCKLQQTLSDEYKVYAAMRYQNPNLKKVLKTISKQKYEELVVLPLFPQYASSTTGSVYEYVNAVMGKWEAIPKVKFINQFYDHPAFIEAFVTQIQQYDYQLYDHIIFSYHGLPNRHLDKIHQDIKSSDCTCNISMPKHGVLCYKATCYETTRLMVKQLGLEESSYSVTFQSRLSNNWMTPFTDELVVEKAKSGCKKILVVAPAFVADCLETTIELAYEYNELFIENGGTTLTLVDSLNANEHWVKAIPKLL